MSSQSTDLPPFDARSFRDTLGRFATGVALVLARDADGMVAGMTINSFASVSIDPPLILWSMRSDTASAEVFRRSLDFTVSILGAEHEPIARRCARSDYDKLEGLEFAPAPSGVPRLVDAMAWFDCRTWATYPGGDHDIIVGLVHHFGGRPGSTLLFQDGSFRSGDA